MTEKSELVFGNPIPKKFIKKAARAQKKYLKKFGDDRNTKYHLVAVENSVLTPAMGVKVLKLSDKPLGPLPEKSIIIGNIRMGFGHYRISMAMASAAHAMGYTPLFTDIPKDTPYIATHVWPSQAAVHAGMTQVVNAIPDNWPMALHLSEGALHTVQTPSSYLGYRTLRGFDGEHILKPIPNNQIAYMGHYIDNEFVENIEKDCELRINRLKTNQPIRYLLSIGGAGAQGDYFAGLIKTLVPYIKEGKAVLYLNIGDYKNVWDIFKSKISEIENLAKLHFDNWDDTLKFAQESLADSTSSSEVSKGIHVFCHKDIFAAVYATNLLMRTCDVLMTKPSELAFYPVPKLMIQHVGGHEKWGAIRAAEVGDGTPECPNLEYAQFMIEQFIKCPELLINMNNAILAAKKSGIYNGAYHAVELAAKITGVDGNGSKFTYAGR